MLCDTNTFIKQEMFCKEFNFFFFSHSKVSSSWGFYHNGMQKTHGRPKNWGHSTIHDQKQGTFTSIFWNENNIYFVYIFITASHHGFGSFSFFIKKFLKEPVNFMDPPKWTKKELPEVTKSFHNYMVKVRFIFKCFIVFSHWEPFILNTDHTLKWYWYRYIYILSKQIEINFVLK